MHPLIERQIRRYLGESPDLPDAWLHLLGAVGEAYAQADADRRVVEHSLDLMSRELTERNRELQRQLLEKQRTEAALRDSRAHLARAQKVARLGSWTWDVQSGRVRWSDETYVLFGVDPGVFVPDYDSTMACVHPDDRAMVEAVVGEALANRQSYCVDHRILLPDGSIRFMHEQGEVERNGQGEAVSVIGTVHDITAHKLVEAALQREKAEQAALIKRLEEAHNQLLQSEKMASIGQLAAGVAHEINNPIGYVNSNLATLRDYVRQLLEVLAVYETEEAALPEGGSRERIAAAKRLAELDYLRTDVIALLDESSDGIARVRRIVQDLKDFSHIDRGEWVLADLRKGLDSTLNVVNNEIKYKARVVKEYGDIPPVRCLSSQLNQVFMNLLVNAAHAIETQGVITVRTGTRGEEVWVEIADTGCGIPESIRSRIFDPFFTTKPIGKGTGLGLSISYGVVRKHGGRIEVESEVGRGTTFRVVLPIQPVESPETGQD